ncbi:hypothetical protein DSUL_80088 [Desulfovibrionales bacterium]
MQYCIVIIVIVQAKNEYHIILVRKGFAILAAYLDNRISYYI